MRRDVRCSTVSRKDQAQRQTAYINENLTTTVDACQIAPARKGVYVLKRDKKLRQEDSVDFHHDRKCGLFGETQGGLAFSMISGQNCFKDGATC